MKKFFFIIWANPKFYQTLVFLSKYLSINNYKIYILHRKIRKNKDFIGRLDFGHKAKFLYCPIDFKFFPTSVNYVIFILFVVFAFFLINPSKVILFNRYALLSSLFISIFKKKNVHFFYHNFDFDNPNKIKSFKQKFISILEKRVLKNINFLVFPSNKRALLYKKFFNVVCKQIFTLQNCFPKNFKIKNDEKFKIFLKKNNLLKKKIICRLGTIGPDHFIDKIVESAKYVSKDTIFVFGGTVVNNFDKKILKKIKKLKLNNKIFIFTNISNSLWFQILKYSKIGLCFYKETNLSHRNMAGTSTKFNNYLMANIPMIVNKNRDFLNFKKKLDLFETVNPYKPRQIANKINFIIKNKKRYMKIKHNQRKAFLKTMNFEHQFNNSYGAIINKQF